MKLEVDINEKFLIDKRDPDFRLSQFQYYKQFKVGVGVII